jgi:hypothetical protein
MLVITLPTGTAYGGRERVVLDREHKFLPRNIAASTCFSTASMVSLAVMSLAQLKRSKCSRRSPIMFSWVSMQSWYLRTLNIACYSIELKRRRMRIAVEPAPSSISIAPKIAFVGRKNYNNYSSTALPMYSKSRAIALPVPQLFPLATSMYADRALHLRKL